MKTFNFEKSIFTFLDDLASNNNKEWFEANRDRYENELIAPLKGFVENIGPFVKTVDQDVITEPAIDKTISRIYRDLRFTKDKTPYKTYLRVTFKKPDIEWKEYPLFHFVVHREGFGHGIGPIRAKPDFMKAFRDYVDENEKQLISLSREFSDYSIRADSFKRKKRADLPETLSQWYNAKNLLLIKYGSREDLLKAEDIIGDLIKEWSRLVPLYKLLWQIKAKV